ncbi:MAG TPA: hypothetical protein VF158_14215 [Longimicrobiales bacterium]
MLAYVFWHYARPGADLHAYEAALRDFHELLGGCGSEGFIESRAYGIDGAPWLPAGPAYEDWYLLEGSAALDPLDRAAVGVRARGAHDRVAAMAGGGAGGLYRRWRAGAAAGPDAVSTCLWVRKPAGASYAAFHDDLDRIVPAEADIWQRQMVLGPAPEYAIVLPGDGPVPGVPAAWEPIAVRRRRVWP